MNILVFLVAVVPALLPAADAGVPFPGRGSTWNGYARHDFEVDGRACIVVSPKEAAAGRPWIWRARFFGHQPQVDLALLARGYHVVYCDVAGLFGSPRAVAHWNQFYATLTEEHGLAKKVALEGMSRGGLIIYNWAAANPEKVACIYADAPVRDFKSWPGGKWQGKGSAADWKKCLDVYGLNEDEADAYRFNPIDQLAALARAGVPILHVIGAADTVVPPAENTAIVVTRYRKLGGAIQVISKPGVGHHPHSLPNPRPIAEFVVRCSRAAGADRTVSRDFDGNVVARGSLTNSRLLFERDKRAHVVFMGGSITEMNGYRPRVRDYLRQRFAAVQFTFTNAGLASTCSTTGAFRLGEDVLRKGPVDLFFVEFAVNDDQDAQHSRRACIRGMEGIVRQVRTHNPNADIVMVDFVNPGMLNTIQHGKTPLTIAAHEAVAEHYAISSVNLAREVAEEILAGQLTWKQYGGTHPAQAGNALCARMLSALLDSAWSGSGAERGKGFLRRGSAARGRSLRERAHVRGAKGHELDNHSVPEASPALADAAQAKAHSLPAPIDALSYAYGMAINPARATRANGWQIKVPDWPHVDGQIRPRFRDIRMLCADQPGAELTLEFRGTLIGAYLLAGPDAGVVSGSVDGAPFSPVNLYHRFSAGLHYPRTVLFAEDLTPGKHLLRLRVAQSTHSAGHAVRIVWFAVNAAPSP